MSKALSILKRPLPAMSASSWAVEQSKATTSLDDAVASYNADHGRSWGKSGGTCPVCGHKGCFGTLDNTTRWACFSSNHGPDSGRVGIQGAGCWHGDALDIAAHAAGRSRVEHLRECGYLSGPRRQALAKPRDAPKATVKVAATVEVKDEQEELREAFEERAGILEFDAGMSREDAEREAARLTGYATRNTRTSIMGYTR